MPRPTSLAGRGGSCRSGARYGYLGLGGLFGNPERVVWARQEGGIANSSPHSSCHWQPASAK
eukprot:scaffold669_cov379-Prasinococcus_capsulatus_cf.AAC.2